MAKSLRQLFIWSLEILSKCLQKLTTDTKAPSEVLQMLMEKARNLIVHLSVNRSCLGLIYIAGFECANANYIEAYKAPYLDSSPTQGRRKSVTKMANAGKDWLFVYFVSSSAS